ncbi:ShlB/FhaC/HecB family hemolysin secretion/activation protein [Rhodocyclaceae bacterium]
MSSRPRKGFPLPASVCALVCATTFAHAQTPPDAGSLLRESERTLRETPAVPVVPPAPPMKEAAKGASVKVAAFRIEGATLLPADELAGLLADHIGRTLSFAELEQAARRIAEHYRTHGWFARVYLPAQDVTDGVVRIQIVEGRFGGALIERDNGTRADADLIQRLAAGRLKTGEPFSAADLERGLLLANDQPGIRATGILEAGDAPGETRLRLKLTDGPRFAGDAGLTNHGTRATGREQVTAGLAWNPGDGSQASLRALAATDLALVRLAYARPLGGDGLRWSIHASDLNYRLGGDFKALNAKGNAQTWGLDLAWPIQRAADRNLSLTATAEQRRYADDSLGTALRRKQIDALQFALNGDRIDGLGGGGLTQASLVLAAGDLDLSGNAADLTADRAGPRAHGAYGKLNARLARLQNLPAGFALHADLSAQWADGNLDSSEQFVLGGPNGVRAYPVSEAGGDEGWLLTLELRKEVSPGWTAMGFLDGGEIRQHKRPWAGWNAGGNVPNRYGLAGAGIGLNWNKPGDYSVQLTLAAPLGGHPGKTAAGKNQDGSAREARAWLRATKYF